ncbi:hypothetical protein AGMMS49587_05440 [Spirochaetia bacterium]|nr:hypothetical protein AGMMS49587_05440 [Spirochaetia bacterium]
MASYSAPSESWNGYWVCGDGQQFADQGAARNHAQKIYEEAERKEKARWDSRNSGSSTGPGKSQWASDPTLTPQEKKVSALISRARASFDKEDWNDAIAAYTELVNYNEPAGKLQRVFTNSKVNYTLQLSTSYNNRGIQYLKNKDYAHALADFNEALKITPGNEVFIENIDSVYIHKGIETLEAKDYDGAIANFTQAVKLAPGEAIIREYLITSYQNRGFQYFRDEKWDNAIVDFEVVRKLDPARIDDIRISLGEAYSSRGQEYLNKEEEKLAVRDCTESLKVNPDSPLAETLKQFIDTLSQAGYGITGEIPEDPRVTAILADIPAPGAPRASAPPRQNLSPALAAAMQTAAKATASSTSGQATAAQTAASGGQTDSAGASATAANKTHGITGYILQIIFALIGSGILGWIGGRLLKGIPHVGPYMGMIGSLAGVLLGFSNGAQVKGIAAYQDYKRKPFRNTILLLALIAVIVGPKTGDLLPRAVNLVAGWVKPSAVTAPAPSAASTATVISDALNLRAEPSANGALLKTLKKGDTLTVTGDTANGWTPVEHDGAKGYVSAQYINIE